MKVAFFTESPFNGKYPRNFPNARTEIAWQIALDADHYNVHNLPAKEYDLGIIIIPKNNSNLVVIDNYRRCCKRVAVMQEGPFWYYQDHDLSTQINYLNNLYSADTVFVHNQQDKRYYEGLLQHPDVRVMRSLMIEDAIPANRLTPIENRSGIMIGGNFKSWYGGMDSYMISKDIDKVYSPKMGRHSEGEDQLVVQLPYMEWNEWIVELSKRKVGVHLMRTHAAGTFALNCSSLGIPCIGYEGLDSQRTLHPDLTVGDGDLVKARRLLKELYTNEEFYNFMTQKTKQLYEELYTEKIFLEEFHSTF